MTRRHAGGRSMSWIEDIPQRARIEATARQVVTDFRARRRQTRSGPFLTYQGQVEVPGYKARTVTIEFDYKLPAHPCVFADGPSGPEASPHRYPWRRRTALCIWHPSDPPERRWVPNDGLLALFGMAAEHLFKEAWWRETREWLGEEYPHEPDGLGEAA